MRCSPLFYSINTRGTLAFVLMCFLAFSCGFTQEKSQKFVSEKGKFKVDFPSTPKLSTNKITDNYGERMVYSYLSTPENDSNRSYEVRYIDFSQEALVDFEGNLIFDLFLSFAKNGQGSSLETMGTLNKKIIGYTGREYRWQDSNSGQLSRMLFYMVRNRMYQLTVVTDEENNHNIYVDQFFDSFELIETKAKPEYEGQLRQGIDGVKSFVIDFPHPTEEREMETLTEYGNTKIFIKGSQHTPGDTENIGYTVTTMRYPKDITENDNFDLKKHYAELIQNGLRNRQSKLISQKEIELDGIRGIETKESFRDGQIIITQQSFLKGDTQILVNVMTIPKNDDNMVMKAFFKSLKL